MRARLADGVAEFAFDRRMMAFEFPFAVPEVVEFWREYYGPTRRAFEALDSGARQAAYRAALEALWSQHNRATDGTTRVESEYLAVVAVRAA